MIIITAAPPVFNLTYLPNYSVFTGPVATVTLMWSSAGGELAEDVEYTLTISTNSTHTTHTTKFSEWTTQLELYQTYLVSAYSSTCQNAIVSDNTFITNITIESCKQSNDM